MPDPCSSLPPPRSPLGSRPPLPGSASRTPFTDSLPELTPRKKLRAPLRLATVQFLAAGLIAGGWFLLDRDTSATLKRTNDPSAATSPAETGKTTTSASTNFPDPHQTAYRGDPREPGLRHITTLQLAGSYSQAADYAVASALDYRRDFTITAYHEWGRHQPEQAMASAIRIEEAFTRDFAMHSVLSGWARSDPEGLAEAARNFPEGDFKNAALKRALRAWMNKDPEAAGDWILAYPDVVPVADEMFRRDRRE